MPDENRARFARDLRNPPTPCDGSGSSGAVSPGEMGPGILGSKPLNADPHKNFRGSHQNLTNKPADKNRGTEPGRRISDRSTTYKY
ncbi:MAG: hypothetical protein WBG18_19450 [Xanthobacteraceae bacterium]